MRTGLKKFEKQRLRFTASFERYGYFKGWYQEIKKTMLLKNIRKADSNEILTEHLWMIVPKEISELDLRYGLELSFDARVSIYRKEYYSGFVKDYCLSYPRNFEILSKTVCSSSGNKVLRVIKKDDLKKVLSRS